MTEQDTEQPLSMAQFEEIQAQNLGLNDVVEGHGLIVKIEDDDTGKVVGFGSTRGSKPHVEESKHYGAETLVKRARIVA